MNISNEPVTRVLLFQIQETTNAARLCARTVEHVPSKMERLFVNVLRDSLDSLANQVDLFILKIIK